MLQNGYEHVTLYAVSLDFVSMALLSDHVYMFSGTMSFDLPETDMVRAPETVNQIALIPI
jgi:hypothetical protein